MLFRLQLFADYFQFYLQDEDAPGDLSDAWTPEASERLLAVAPGVVGIGTARNMTVPVTLELRETAPGEETGADLITEATLDVGSGRLVIAGCTDYFPDAKRIPVSRGRYRVRVHSFALSRLSDDGLNGEDSYQVVLWPDGELVPPRILYDRRDRDV